MKRILAFTLAVLMLFLCACSGKENDETTAIIQQPATLPLEQASRNQTEPASAGWVTSMLPEKFAKQPEGSIAVSTQNIAKSYNSPYNSDIVRLILRCRSEHMDAFSKELIALGYVGGVEFYSDSEIYGDNVIGHWTNDEYIVTINSAEASTDQGDSMSHTLEIDVVKCMNGIPAVLAKAFPELKTAWTINEGDYVGLTSNFVETAKANDTLSDAKWIWNFKDTNAFIGVSEDEFDNFINELTLRGFECYPEVENDGNGEIRYCSAEYEYGGDVFGAYLCYVTYLSTLEIIFSNDITYFQ